MPGIGATENSQSGMYPNCFIGENKKKIYRKGRSPPRRR